MHSCTFLEGQETCFNMYIYAYINVYMYMCIYTCIHAPFWRARRRALISESCAAHLTNHEPFQKVNQEPFSKLNVPEHTTNKQHLHKVAEHWAVVKYCLLSFQNKYHVVPSLTALHLLRTLALEIFKLNPKP